MRQPKGAVQCKAQAKSTGMRCKTYAPAGLEVCLKHGGAAPASVKRRAIHETRVGLARLVQPIDEDDLEADPIHGFNMEWRRTVAAIRFCDYKIAQLKGEDDLIWGKTEEVLKGATEFPGLDETFAATLNGWEVKRQWERTHLTDLLKLYVAANIAEKASAREVAIIDRLDRMFRAFTIAAGLDPESNEVRAAMRDAIDAEITSTLALPSVPA